MPPFTVTEPGVLKLLNNFNPSKAGVQMDLLLELATKIAPVLTTIFCQGEVPTEWRTLWGSPIFEKGVKCDPAIKLSTHIADVYQSKLLEHIISSQIRSHLDKHEIFSPFQHEFRGKYSCKSQLNVIYQDLARLND